MFENLSGADVPAVTQLMFGLMIAGGLIVAAACVVRILGAWRLFTTIARRRRSLLAVVEVAVVDGWRRLILIRRDNTEHLMMIGGPNDLIIEANIAVAAMPRQARAPHPSASGDTQPPGERAGEGSTLRPQPEPARPEPPRPEPMSRLPEHQKNFLRLHHR
jgi:flagellar protein FliO/FliZ